MRHPHQSLGYLLVAAVLGCGAGRREPAPPEREPSIEQRYEELEAIMVAAQEREDPETDVAVAMAYARLFDETTKRSALTGDLGGVQRLFGAAELTAFHSLEPRHVTDLLRAADVLEARGALTDDQRASLRKLVIKARMFESPMPSRVLASLRVPRIVDESEGRDPSVLIIEPASDVLSRRYFDVRATRVIVASHPRCHFSAAAMQDIWADPTLRRVFREHARWLLPQESDLDVDLLRTWNADPDNFVHAAVYARAELPAVTSWATPTFYFLTDGKVRATVHGWPKGGRLDELRTALRSIGLLE